VGGGTAGRQRVRGSRAGLCGEWGPHPRNPRAHLPAPAVRAGWAALQGAELALQSPLSSLDHWCEGIGKFEKFGAREQAPPIVVSAFGSSFSFAYRAGERKFKGRVWEEPCGSGRLNRTCRGDPENVGALRLGSQAARCPSHLQGPAQLGNAESSPRTRFLSASWCRPVLSPSELA
jgi:hypothetical protein